MAELPFTAGWASALREAINGSEPFRSAAAQWQWPLAMVMLRDEERGVLLDAAVLLELEGGRCTGARALPVEAIAAPFIFRAPYLTWKRVVRSELDPIAAVISGAISFEGRLATLVAHHMVARELVKCAQQVPTIFPDEPSSRAE